MKKEIILGVLMLGVSNTLVVPQAHSSSINPYATFLALPNLFYSDVGAIYAVNEDLSKDGWLLRGQIYGGFYGYDYGSPGESQSGVNYYGVLGMGGYQWNLEDGATFSLYGGLELQQNDDNLAGVFIHGTSLGGSGIAELYVPFDEKFYGYGKIYFSSIWTTYSFMGKLGYKANQNLALGSEFAALGNDCLETKRLGPFISYNLSDNLQVIGSVGYNFDTKPIRPNDYSGMYGMLYLGWVY